MAEQDFDKRMEEIDKQMDAAYQKIEQFMSISEMQILTLRAMGEQEHRPEIESVFKKCEDIYKQYHGNVGASMVEMYADYLDQNGQSEKAVQKLKWINKLNAFKRNEPEVQRINEKIEDILAKQKEAEMRNSLKLSYDEVKQEVDKINEQLVKHGFIIKAEEFRGKPSCLVLDLKEQDGQGIPTKLGYAHMVSAIDNVSNGQDIIDGLKSSSNLCEGELQKRLKIAYVSLGSNKELIDSLKKPVEKDVSMKTVSEEKKERPTGRVDGKSAIEMDGR